MKSRERETNNKLEVFLEEPKLLAALYTVIVALGKQVGAEPTEVCLSEISSDWQCSCGNSLKGQLGDKLQYCSKCGQKAHWD